MRAGHRRLPGRSTPPAPRLCPARQNQAASPHRKISRSIGRDGRVPGRSPSTQRSAG